MRASLPAALAAVLLTVSLTAVAHAAAPPSARAYYRMALDRMREVAEPSYLTYRTIVPSGHTTMLLSSNDRGRAEIRRTIRSPAS